MFIPFKGTLTLNDIKGTLNSCFGGWEHLNRISWLLHIWMLGSAIHHLLWFTRSDSRVSIECFWFICYESNVLIHWFWFTRSDSPGLSPMFWFNPLNGTFLSPHVLNQMFWFDVFDSHVLIHLFWITDFDSLVLIHTLWFTCPIRSPCTLHLVPEIKILKQWTCGRGLAQGSISVEVYWSLAQGSSFL